MRYRNVEETEAEHLRKYAVLRTPEPADSREQIYKVMLHTTREGIMCYLYTTPNTALCSYEIAPMQISKRHTRTGMN